MAYMAQQALTTAVRDAFRDRGDALEQVGEATRFREWLTALPLPPAVLAPIIEPIAAIDAGLREADRLRRREDAPETSADAARS